MAINPLRFKHRSARFVIEVMRLSTAAALVVAISACSPVSESFTRGQKITPDQLEQVPVGSSREQVLLALGTPTSTGLTGGEVFYYISQTSARSVAFQRPSVRDRRILAVYLDQDGDVTEIAEYGLKDGKVFDYLSRKTRTSGSDLAFVTQVLGGLMNPSL
ncbi:outer membrane protein assembly factor BamE [Acuticoccus sp. M5D2P5]|uniref:outer membrane protein assembly factor BamE n=1 Tax=Acuticoccus kalidii TaxID=2910977 RepID=UPI001F16D76E|nr:outer membrane protein assembly factor BamE [Acuticoccus kalidii]MCF3936360.1 outer membrane protein assembly factor BamE [Acuticoccus kalidii]